jgi:hypothetical protein
MRASLSWGETVGAVDITSTRALGMALRRRAGILADVAQAGLQQFSGYGPRRPDVDSSTA